MLDVLKPQAYVPMDISRDHLKKAAQTLSADYPWLDVHASCIDFTEKLHLPNSLPEVNKKVAFFPGSSIGNFEPQQATHFMRHVLNMVGSEGGMLIGVDLKKDENTLTSAYNDAKGVTADFNLNLLSRINGELDANFELEHFNHNAFYNADAGRIEMHLVSQKSQKIKIGEHLISFNTGETIHTESSYKYTINEFQELGRDAGFTPVHVWTDSENLFSVHYFEATAS